jgi:hypothetical protein
MYWTLDFRLFIHFTNAPQNEKDDHELWKIKHHFFQITFLLFGKVGKLIFCKTPMLEFNLRQMQQFIKCN